MKKLMKAIMALIIAGAITAGGVFAVSAGSGKAEKSDCFKSVCVQKFRFARIADMNSIISGIEKIIKECRLLTEKEKEKDCIDKPCPEPEVEKEKDCIDKPCREPEIEEEKECIEEPCREPEIEKEKPSDSVPKDPSDKIPDSPSDKIQDDIPDKPSDAVPDTTPSSGKGDREKENNGVENGDYIDAVIRLVNEERAKYNLSALKKDEKACRVAGIRAKETVSLFSHTRPDGRSCFTAASDEGLTYRYAGENIAYGYRSPEEVVRGWMNSTGHRENILSEKYTAIGVGCVNAGGVLYWSQFFIG